MRIKTGRLDRPRAQEYSLTQLLRDLPAYLLWDELWDTAMEDYMNEGLTISRHSPIPCCDVLTVLCWLHGAGLLGAVDGVLHQELFALLLPLHQPAVVPGTDGPLHLLADCAGLPGGALGLVNCLADWL